MGQQLSWVLSGRITASGKGARALRRRLAVTTILAVAPFLGYGRQAYAACTEIGTTAVWECSGANNATQTIADDDAIVSTLPGFSVNAAAGTGIEITGNGHLQFTDENASTIVGTDDGLIGFDDGLYVRSGGNSLANDGAVTITTNGDITGEDFGIHARNYGDGGIDIEITGEGQVTSLDRDALYAFNAGNAGEGLTIETSALSVITGDDNGIAARNDVGDLEITANGMVTGGANGQDFRGIAASNAGNDLLITTGSQSSITGQRDGIFALNEGDGDLEVKAYGQVTGIDDNGIYARNGFSDLEDEEIFGGNLIVVTGAQSEVIGGDNGILAGNFGNGYLAITADGIVTGEDGDGIHAVNVSGEVHEIPSDELLYLGAATDLTITTVQGSAVTGYSDGIEARNFGAGNLTITANGTVTGEDGDGIRAINVSGYYLNDTETKSYDGQGVDLTVTTGAESVVTGADDGIDAENFGTGNLTITANGLVTGEEGDGIIAFNSYRGNDLIVTTNAGSSVSAYFDGVDAQNYGTGNLEITVNGQVTTEDDNGIEADNYGNNLTIITGAESAISAGHDGISASQFGGGDLEITAHGDVEGRGDDGIYAANYGQNFKVTTGAQSVVTGVDDGIDARHYGGGSFEIIANGHVTGSDSNGIEALNSGDGDADTVIEVGAAGLVQGSYSGIFADSRYGQDIEITNEGLVRNLSGESDDRAITTYGGATEIINNGDLVGTVQLDFATYLNDTLENNGLWNTADGFNEFGNGNDEVINRGTLRAAADPSSDESTTFANLEVFDNDGGLITLVDGQAGDRIHLAGQAVGAMQYQSTDGRLAVDAVLGPPGDGDADQLRVNGSISGTTLVHVNVVGVTGANSEGIQVVLVLNGTTVEEDFDLDGALNAGFYSWDLRLDDEGGALHELYTSGVGIGGYEFAAGLTGAQEVWHQTTATLLHRQADLRTLFGLGVTPAADYGEPVAPTPTAHITPGFWMRGIGAYIERDDEQDGFVLDREQTVYGGMAGFDFGSESAGDAWLFGIFGGYLVSDLKFKETNSKWNYEGPTVGAYATYLNDAFYADLTVKADILDIDIDPDDLAPGEEDADTDALNIGGRIDTGYKFGRTVFIEPQASLAVLHTEIDDVDIFGGTVEFDDETSVRGRLGLRLGLDHTGDNQVVYTGDVTGSVWEEFAGDNNVTIVGSGVPDFGASDDPGETYWDVSAGLSMAAPDGWSGFIRANYLFADDYDAITGNAGVRWAW
ncbi:autotransporter outer membrane beta-barrel domain-containing protein [Taklimakanibacter lacteus]|uniref:autotransporter outer membrane beta-barrel domain-containing protein n=1 Tax=Taklimakanibacter lacteus TaxID=2268456 RepID=UPI0013C462A8